MNRDEVLDKVRHGDPIQAVDISGLDLIGGCHTSPIGSGDEESTLIGLIYYDSIAERAEWKAAFPETEIPAHRELPYDRDRLLPGPGYQDETPF